MKRISIITVIALLLTACASTKDVIPDSIANSIPKGATEVIVSSPLPADSLYQNVYHNLVLDGYSIQHTSDKMHQITTSGRNLGDIIKNSKVPVMVEGTTLTLNVMVIKGHTGSEAVFAGNCKMGIFTGGFSAQWRNGGYNVYKYAFACLIREAKELKGKISYK